MKPIIDLIFGSIRWVLVFTSTVIGGWIWLELHFDSKVEASEKRVLKEVTLMRDTDLVLIRSIKEDTNLIKRALIKAP
jgi:hypothetical protein